MRAQSTKSILRRFIVLMELLELAIEVESIGSKSRVILSLLQIADSKVCDHVPQDGV